MMNQTNNPNTPHDDAGESSVDASLDRLLAQAKWPQPNARQIAHLEACWERAVYDENTTDAANVNNASQVAWEEKGGSKKNRARWAWSLAATAALGWFTAAALGYRLYQRDGAGQQPRPTASPLAPRHKPSKDAVPETENPDKGISPKQIPVQPPLRDLPGSRALAQPAKQPDAKQAAPEFVSPPSLFQQAVFIAHHAPHREIKQSKINNTRQHEISLNDDPSPLEFALDELASRPHVEPESLVAPLLERREYFESRLLEMLVEVAPRNEAQDPTVEELPARQTTRRVHLCRLLTHVATSKSIAVLHDLLHDRQARVRLEARAALQHIADRSTLVQLARAERQPGLQTPWLAELLRRGELADVVFFVACVEDRRTLRAAQQAIEEVDDPPIEALFHLMNSPMQTQRMTAARVLGATSHPEATDGLIGMVDRHENRHEALVGLLCSSDPRAQRFLAYLSVDRAMAGALQAASAQLQSLLWDSRL